MAEIERVRVEGGRALSFDSEPFRQLARIPVEIDGISGLTFLSLNHTQVVDLAPLAGLAALETLWLDSTQVADLAPLAGLRRLQSIWLDSTEVDDLTHLASLSALQLLGLTNTRVVDLTPLGGLTKLQNLWLDNTGVTDLTPIGGLTALRQLMLNSTKVADAAPLAGLTALRVLEVNDTAIADLAAIRSLTELKSIEVARSKANDLRPVLHALHPGKSQSLDDVIVETSSHVSYRFGLDFTDTPFANATAETRRLAAIKDRRERTLETLAFLRTLPPWPEPLPWELAEVEKRAASGESVAAPEQDPALPLIWGERGFGFLIDHIGIDPVTQEVLADLRALLDALIRQSGNSHEDLYQLAREMRARCEPENGTLNALRLHLTLQKMERLHAARDRRDRALDDEIVTTLDGVLRVAPGATLADPKVRELIDRQEANLRPPPPLDAARAGSILHAVARPEAPFAPEVKEVAALAEVPDRLGAARVILARNVVVAVGRRLARIATSPSEVVASGVLIGWVWANSGSLRAYALSLGTDVAVWLARVLRELGRVAPPF